MQQDDDFIGLFDIFPDNIQEILNARERERADRR